MSFIKRLISRFSVHHLTLITFKLQNSSFLNKIKMIGIVKDQLICYSNKIIEAL